MAAPALRTRPGLLLSSRQSVNNWQRLWVPGGRCLLPVPSSSRQKSAKAAMKAMDRRRNKQNPPVSPTVEQRGQQTFGDSIGISIILPATIARPPLSHFPRSPKPFFRFSYLWLKQQFIDTMGRWVYKFSSKASIFKRPAFRQSRRQIVPTAKAMHAAMSEALARGDKMALRRICTSKLMERYSSVIERRPPGKRFSWELVRYNKTWLYPRIVDDKVAMLREGGGTVRQVVVAIASRQRRVEYDDSPRGGGRVVPGSEKEADLHEYVVMCAAINQETHRQKEWRLLGTIGETTLESFESERALIKEAEDAELGKYKV